MKISFPLYYKDFKCIAEKCRHSCCVGWEIGLDSETEEKYDLLSDKSEILSHVEDGEIRLCDDGRCPFLLSDGLCRLICDYGEEYTSYICRHHPRFYHRVGRVLEGGIGASCEEAARIILSSENYSESFTAETEAEIGEETDFDSLPHRERIYSLLSDREISYHERLSKIREAYGLSDNLTEAEEWNEFLSELEYLEEDHRELIRIGKREPSESNHIYFERFFAYLIYRHATVAENELNLRARIGFCLLLADIFENLVASGRWEFCEIVDFARIISEEIEYSEDNSDSIIFEFECKIN